MNDTLLIARIQDQLTGLRAEQMVLVDRIDILLLTLHALRGEPEKFEDIEDPETDVLCNCDDELEDVEHSELCPVHDHPNSPKDPQKSMCAACDQMPKGIYCMQHGGNPSGLWFTKKERSGWMEVFQASGEQYGLYRTTPTGVREAWNDAADYGCRIGFYHEEGNDVGESGLNHLLEEITEHLCKNLEGLSDNIHKNGGCRKIVQQGYFYCPDCIQLRINSASRLEDLKPRRDAAIEKAAGHV